MNKSKPRKDFSTEMNSPRPLFRLSCRGLDVDNSAVKIKESVIRKVNKRLESFWGFSLVGEVRFYFFSSETALLDNTGVQNNHVNVSTGEIFSVINSSPGHELNHLYVEFFASPEQDPKLEEGIACVLNHSKTNIRWDLLAAEQFLSENANTDPVKISQKSDEPFFAISFNLYLLRLFGEDFTKRVIGGLWISEDKLFEYFGKSQNDFVKDWFQHLKVLWFYRNTVRCILEGEINLDPSILQNEINCLFSGYGPDAEIALLVGDFLFEKDQIDKALLFYKKACDLNHDFHQPVWIYGALYSRMEILRENQINRDNPECYTRKLQNLNYTLRANNAFYKEVLFSIESLIVNTNRQNH